MRRDEQLARGNGQLASQVEEQNEMVNPDLDC
jgi:hypothetical protein